MGDKTGIEWTDATWNPTVGCSVLSPGCAHCYAMRFAAQLAAMSGNNGGAKFRGLTVEAKPGYHVWNGTVRLADKIDQPLHWKKPRRIFVNSMSDLFHERLPDEAIDRVFAVMALAPQHTFQVLTKRAERMRDYLSDVRCGDRWCYWAGTISQRDPGPAPDWPLPNVWLGTSVEDQERADERIPHLLATPAAVRFLSCEPLLGAIALGVSSGRARCPLPPAGIDWVIVGGESGPRARPFDVAWARSIVAQCRAGSVACFVKQLGSAPKERWSDGPTEGLAAIRLKDRKGGDWDEWAADLRVREFPANVAP